MIIFIIKNNKKYPRLVQTLLLINQAIHNQVHQVNSQMIPHNKEGRENKRRLKRIKEEEKMIGKSDLDLNLEKKEAKKIELIKMTKRKTSHIEIRVNKKIERVHLIKKEKVIDQNLKKRNMIDSDKKKDKNRKRIRWTKNV